MGENTSIIWFTPDFRPFLGIFRPFWSYKSLYGGILEKIIIFGHSSGNKEYSVRILAHIAF